MISLRRPSSSAVRSWVAARAADDPTFDRATTDVAGFRTDHTSAELGRGDATFAAARQALRRWQPHVGSGVEVIPADAPLEVGTTVGILTRQLGLWILAACRVTAVVDASDECGFTYVTLPGHPECGEETFTVRRRPDGRVDYSIDVTWRSAAVISRLGGPVTTRVQARATRRYLDAMRRAVAVSPGPG